MQYSQITRINVLLMSVILEIVQHKFLSIDISSYTIICDLKSLNNCNLKAEINSEYKAVKQYF